MKWSEIYDTYFNMIEKSYIEKWYEIYSEPNVLNPSPPDDFPTFLESTKKLFLRKLEEGFYCSAFKYLQKKIPILSEHIMHYCFDNKVFNKDEFSEIFIELYIYAKKDRTLFSNEINNEKLINMFKYCNFKGLIDNEDTEYINNLAYPLNIYRGATGKTFEEAITGISWTSNFNKALEFAEFNLNEFNNKNAIVVEGKIIKEDVILYINKSGRYENEIITDPKTVFDKKIIKTFANT